MTEHVHRFVKSSHPLEMRGGGSALPALPAEGELVELELGDGLSLFTGGGNELESQVNDLPGQRDGASPLVLRSDAPTQRGAAGLVIKGLKVLGVDVEAWLGIDSLKNHAANVIADKAALLADGREVTGRKGGLGLYRCDGQTAYAERLSAPATVSSNGQALVLVHGFFSSTGGAFEGLWKPVGSGVRDALLKHYQGAMYGFDHATLGQNPISNALALAKGLPDGARLHMLAHSRGGLVCELLSRAQFGQDAILPRELELFEIRQPEDADALRELIRVMRTKELQVERLVRAGSPIRGTWLASNRLDRWLSIFYNVVRQAVPQGPQFVADHVFDVIATVVKKRLEREHFPGIEAMSPTSPLMGLLNDAPPELRQRLTVIAGDCVGSGLMHRLKMLITDGFFGEPHDLVVPTSSMFGGAPRSAGVRYFFHQTPRVDHFHYFSQGESLKRVQVGLIGDDKQYERLQLLSQITERPRLVANRSVKPDAPLNVVLPGIMGTELAYKDNNRLWVDLVDFFCGNFPKLVLDAQSQEAPYPRPGTREVYPLGPMDKFYGDLMDALQKRGELVLSAGYDWRKPIHVAADMLAARLASDWPEGSPRPLRLVAHSMGGLVARALFARHPRLRERFVQSPRNRLLMLGTPNAGSMAIVRALLRDNKQIGLIAGMSPQTQTELLTVAATFPGFHELLPQSGRIWANQSVWDKLYEQNGIAVSQRPNLSAGAMSLASRGRQGLRDSLGTLPLSNSVYVAGFVDPEARDATVVDIDEGGRYVKGPGDGTVSYASGLINGIPAYYANAKHGDLPAFRRAFNAYFELLERGETSLLPKDWKSLQEARRGVQLEALEQEQLPYRPSRRELLYSLLGATAPDVAMLTVSHADPITLRVVNGGLRFARYPLIVGHYQGDVMQGSEAEVDRQFDGQMQTALDLGVYPGPVESFQVFERRQDTHDRRSPFAVVVGLGRPGELSVGELRRTVKRGILGWFGTALSGAGSTERTAFSIVLLGSSVSGMSVSECARAILQGVQDAQSVVIKRLQAADGTDASQGIGEVELIELYEDKALELVAELPRLIDTDEFRDRFRVAAGLEERADALHRLRDEGRGATSVRRLDIRAVGGRLRYSLPGIQAAVPVMKRDIDIAEIQAYAREIDQQLSTDRVLGRVLFNQLLPLELKHFALEQYDVLLTLNQSAASLPWELADAGSKLPLSVQSGMIRQLRSARYTPRERVSNNSALVVGEPVVEGLPSLPGARREAEAVADVLKTAGFEVIYLDQPTAVQVRDELGRRPYRVIHFAGHGVVDYVGPLGGPGAKPRTGMVIGSLLVNADPEPGAKAGVPAGISAASAATRGGSDERDATKAEGTVVRHWLLLTPDDVRECVAQVPEMVFINCCHLGRQPGVARNAPKMASNFANSFMEIGCRAVVAAGWAVEDSAAQCFAETFYACMVQQGDRFIDAVRRARETTYSRHSDSTPTWGAYQCYGDPSYGALRRTSSPRPPHFNTARELKYWVCERATACMGLTGDALEALRAPLLEALASDAARWLNPEDVFDAVISACEKLGAYQFTAELIRLRIDERRSVSVRARVIHARVCLRIAMQLQANPAKQGLRWQADAKKALTRVESLANLENSGTLWFDLSTLLRRWFVLQDTRTGRLAALARLVLAAQAAWDATQKGIEQRLGHVPAHDELVVEINDAQAQKTLSAIIIARLIATTGRKNAKGPVTLPSYAAMREHCTAKLERDEVAVEFWDDVDLADLKLLLLATPPSLLSANVKQLSQDEYDRQAGHISALYRFGMSLSATEGERDSIAAYIRFWYEVAVFFGEDPATAEQGHWDRLRRALMQANLPGVPVVTAKPRPSRVVSKATPAARTKARKAVAEATVGKKVSTKKTASSKTAAGRTTARKQATARKTTRGARKH